MAKLMIALMAALALAAISVIPASATTGRSSPNRHCLACWQAYHVYLRHR